MGHAGRHDYGLAGVHFIGLAAELDLKFSFYDRHERIVGSAVLAQGLSLVESEQRNRPFGPIYNGSAHDGLFLESDQVFELKNLPLDVIFHHEHPFYLTITPLIGRVKRKARPIKLLCSQYGYEILFGSGYGLQAQLLAQIIQHRRLYEGRKARPEAHILYPQIDERKQDANGLLFIP